MSIPVSNICRSINTYIVMPGIYAFDTIIVIPHIILLFMKNNLMYLTEVGYAIVRVRRSKVFCVIIIPHKVSRHIVLTRLLSWMLLLYLMLFNLCYVIVINVCEYLIFYFSLLNSRFNATSNLAIFLQYYTIYCLLYLYKCYTNITCMCMCAVCSVK